MPKLKYDEKAARRAYKAYEDANLAHRIGVERFTDLDPVDRLIWAEVYHKIRDAALLEAAEESALR